LLRSHLLVAVLANEMKVGIFQRFGQ